MITNHEIWRFCDALDVEYRNEIRPALKTAYVEIKRVFDKIQNNWFDDICKKSLSDRFHMRNIMDANTEVADCLTALGWYEDSVYDFVCDKKVGSIDNCDFEEFAFGGILSRMSREDALKAIASAKRRFTIIKNAYTRMFKPTDSDSRKTLFDEFKGIVERYHDSVARKYDEGDTAIDEEIRRLFKKNP